MAQGALMPYRQQQKWGALARRLSDPPRWVFLLPVVSAVMSVLLAPESGPLLTTPAWAVIGYLAGLFAMVGVLSAGLGMARARQRRWQEKARRMPDCVEVVWSLAWWLRDWSRSGNRGVEPSLVSEAYRELLGVCPALDVLAVCTADLADVPDGRCNDPQCVQAVRSAREVVYSFARVSAQPQPVQAR